MKHLLLAALLSALATPAFAADAPAKPPCDNFAWETKREQAAFAAAPAEATPSGTTATALPAGAVRLALGPFIDAAFPTPPERAPKDPATAKGGWIALPALTAGAYQITIDGKLWVDVVQGGKTAVSTAHSSDPTCTAFHKSVRFTLSGEPVTLQFSGADATSAVFTILPVE